MSREKETSATPEVDYVLRALGVLADAALRLVTSVAGIGVRLLCLLVRRVLPERWTERP